MTDFIVNHIDAVVSFFCGAIIPSVGWIYQYRKDKRSEKIQLKQENSAYISANIAKYPQGKRILYVFNKGNATAYNVQIHVLSGMNGFVTYPQLPNDKQYEIAPQGKREFVFHLFNNHEDELHLSFNWDDADAKGKTSSIHLQL